MFYIKYALRNILRGGRWTALAIFCIATGVATVVALRGLGLAINDSLVENVRVDNKGDVRLIKGNASQFSALFPNDEIHFTDAELGRIETWALRNGASIAAFADDTRQIARMGESNVGRLSFITTYYINPTTYPPNYTITALEPTGVPLRDLFTGGNEIVISQNMAETQNLRVGDSVRVSGTQTEFTVKGIVATNNESGIRNLFASFFGFAYIDMRVAQQTIRDTIRPNNIGIAVSTPPQNQSEYRALTDTLHPMTSNETGRTRVDTAYDLLERNAVISEILGNFIVVLGLGALLIGGVGIMNTMLVMVRRRTIEISALKTFGLKSHQIAVLFFVEGVCLGVLGSVIGSGLGILLGGVVNQYGETFLQQNIAWRIYPEALLYGFVLGLVTTAVFSLAPILTALKIRPSVILRPNDTVIPRLGCINVLMLMAIVTIALGLIVGQIVSPTFNAVDRGAVSRFIEPQTPYMLGVIGVAVTLAILGVLVVLLWWLVFFIGKLPHFRNVYLKLALRNLSNQRVRTATTLLALSAGMFALSVITFVGEGTRELLSFQLTKQAGGNVLSLPIAPGRVGAGISQLAIDGALMGVWGIRSRTTIEIYQSPLLAIDGEATDFDPLQEPDKDLAAFVWSGFLVRDSTNPNFYQDAIQIVEGRNLTADDRGKRVAVVPSDSARTLGVSVGSILAYNLGITDVTFEVVGLAGGAGGGGFFGTGGIYVPPNSMGDEPLTYTLYSFDVEPTQLNSVLVALSTIAFPPIYSVDVNFIDGLVGRLVDQFAAIPTVVGILSLASAGVIMANTVALATLERRRQIGVLKAIGLKGRRVLAVMLIESSLITLFSAVLGLLLSGAFLWFLQAVTSTPVPLSAQSRLLAIILVGVAFLIGWIATLLSASVATRERVMNVLRYE
jgi:ABC-type antimicrobial peptide transport system permease subunit